MRLRQRPPIGVVLPLVGMLGCAPQTDAVAERPAGYPESVAMAGCAPWDGPATSIFLTPDVVAPVPKPGAEIPRPHVWVSLYRSVSELGGERIAIDQQNSGAAARCEGDGGCESAYRGWVRVLEAGVGTGVRGAVHLEFATGAPIVGSFDATWHETTMICG